MRRFFLILLGFFIFYPCAFSSDSALVPVLEGNVVIDVNEEENIPNYMDIIELQNFEKINFKSDLYKNPKNIKYENTKPSEIFIKQGNFTLESNSKRGIDSDLLINNIKRSAEIKYNKKFYEVSGGYLSKYQYTDATKGSQSVFLNNKFSAGKRFSIELGNYINPKSREFSQEIGLNYKAKYIEGANFGFLGGTTFSEDKAPTHKVHFTTDFYIK